MCQQQLTSGYAVFDTDHTWVVVRGTGLWMVSATHVIGCATNVLLLLSLWSVAVSHWQSYRLLRIDHVIPEMAMWWTRKAITQMLCGLSDRFDIKLWCRLLNHYCLSFSRIRWFVSINPRVKMTNPSRLFISGSVSIWELPNTWDISLIWFMRHQSSNSIPKLTCYSCQTIW